MQITIPKSFKSESADLSAKEEIQKVFDQLVTDLRALAVNNNGKLVTDKEGISKHNIAGASFLLKFKVPVIESLFVNYSLNVRLFAYRKGSETGTLKYAFTAQTTLQSPVVNVDRSFASLKALNDYVRKYFGLKPKAIK